MVRSFALLLVLVFLGVMIVWAIRNWRQSRSYSRSINHRQIVMDETIQRNARSNYVLLEHTIGFIERVLEADGTFPIFSTRQREEARELVGRFNQTQLDK